ncbi:MAG: SPOR domain-containing protein [Melioribacteraceae bacterium]|nr:SPOR domain-containing protein [Melioribacteraceae bacterium]
MNKEELKNIVLEILGHSDDSVFNQFIRQISLLIEGDQALKLNGIGHFQIKKEPLSRMERKMEGSISEKEILLFLPEGEVSEEKIISFEIDEHPKSPNEFSESVFDVSIDKPTIISEPDIEVPKEDSLNDDEKLINNINEFIESGEVIEGYKLLDATQSNIIPTIEDEKIDNEEVITDDIIAESSAADFTEAEINKEFMNDDLDDEPVEEDDDYNVASSSIEAAITEEDVNASEAEIEKDDDETEIEAEIGSEFEAENSELNEDDTNPFDELDNYIKDETKDEAQEIIDAEPETVEESNEELANSSLSAADSHEEDKLNKTKKSGSDEWYKNPILYIATISFIAALVVLYIFIPTSGDTVSNNESSSFEITTPDDIRGHSDFVDSVATSDSTINEATQIVHEPTTVEKLAEIEKVRKDSKGTEEKVQDSKEKASATNVIKPKISTTSTGLYREIENDKNITKRIYFDGERYTVQSSSWRSTTIAEREVSKLKKRGFDAFIYKVYIASKNGTWNRVRIGYFNTQKEAEEFLKKNKI